MPRRVYEERESDEEESEFELDVEKKEPKTLEEAIHTTKSVGD